jgi:hypothetical protein
MFTGLFNNIKKLNLPLNRYSVRRNSLNAFYYISDDSEVNFDPNPVVARGLTKAEADNVATDYNSNNSVFGRYK